MDSVIEKKSFRFALRIVKLNIFLREVKGEYTMSKQLLRSGTSIGANVAEAKHAQSRADFAHKMNIALKEAAETDFWLRLLWESNYLTQEQFDSVICDCDELERMLAATVKTLKKTDRHSPFSTLT